MEQQGLTGETQTCDARARIWCLRVSTLSIVVIIFTAMLFYSWGGVLFDDDPYILAYVNGCTNISIGLERVNDTSWRLEKHVNVFWIPSPPDGEFFWDGDSITLGCVSVLGIGL
jgi:hypothetical protein